MIDARLVPSPPYQPPPRALAHARRRRTWSAPLRAGEAELDVPAVARWVREACALRFPARLGFTCLQRPVPECGPGSARVEIRGAPLTGVIIITPASGRGTYREPGAPARQVKIVATVTVEPRALEEPSDDARAPARRFIPGEDPQVTFHSLLSTIAVCALVWFAFAGLAVAGVLDLERALTVAIWTALGACFVSMVGAPVWRHFTAARPPDPRARAEIAWRGVCRELDQVCRSLRDGRLPAVAAVARARP